MNCIAIYNYWSSFRGGVIAKPFDKRKDYYRLFVGETPVY